MTDNFRESEEFQRLIGENETIIQRLTPKNHVEGRKYELEFIASFENRDTALAARNYIIKNIEPDDETLVVIQNHRFQPGSYNCRIIIELELLNDAISEHEYFMNSAAKKFGGKHPGWGFLVDPN